MKLTQSNHDIQNRYSKYKDTNPKFTIKDWCKYLQISTGTWSNFKDPIQAVITTDIKANHVHWKCRPQVSTDILGVQNGDVNSRT